MGAQAGGDGVDRDTGRPDHVLFAAGEQDRAADPLDWDDRLGRPGRGREGAAAERPGRFAGVGPARVHDRAWYPGDDPVDELGEVRAEQQGGFAAPRVPGDQQMISIHPGLGPQHLKGAGEVLQGNVVQGRGQAGSLAVGQGQARIAMGGQQRRCEAGGQAPAGAAEDQHRGMLARGVLGQVQVGVDPASGRAQLLLDHTNGQRALLVDGGRRSASTPRFPRSC